MVVVSGTGLPARSVGGGRSAARRLDGYNPSYRIAVIYSGFKDKDQVIHWLGKALQERSSWLVWSNVEPRFAWLRDDPDFVALMKAINFPQSSR